mgnify:CR=1 FL=1
MELSIKSRLVSGEKLFGAWAEGSSTTNVEVLGMAGYDFVIIDNEHACHSNPNFLHLIRAAEIREIAPIVRVPGPVVEDHFKKALDMGASGVLVPNIYTKEDAERSVRYSKYAPIGNRGCCPFLRSNLYGTKYGTVDYYPKSNDEVSTILLFETKESVANIDDILSVHGIDSVFIGPVDLAMSMGIPGDNNNLKLVETIRYIARKAHEYHLSAGMFCESPEMLRKWVNEVDYVTTGYDVSILLNAATKALQDFKAAIC